MGVKNEKQNNKLYVMFNFRAWEKNKLRNP